MALSSGCSHRCPPHNSCYGLYQYCRQSSRAVEPCVLGILGNDTARFDLCRDIITRVKNESDIFTYDESCNLKAACFSEFGDKFTCSAESEPQVNAQFQSLGAVQPCVLGILGNDTTARFDLCRDIITRVKNESNISTYDKSCNLKAACFSEFGDYFTCSAESEPQKNIPEAVVVSSTAEADFIWKWVSVAAFVVIVVLVVIAVYSRRESKKQKEKIAGLEKKMKLRTAGNSFQGVAESNGLPPSFRTNRTRRIYNEPAPNSGSTRATKWESNGAESVSLVSSLRDEGDGDSSPVSMAPTSVTVHYSPPVSTTSLPVANTAQSNESLNDSFASCGSQHNEDSQSTSTTSNELDNYNHHRHSAETDNHQSQRWTYASNEHDNNHHRHSAETDNHQNQRSFHTSNEHNNNNHHEHPTETDNQNQRSIHFPSTEPSGPQITVVTSMPSVHQPLRRGLE